MKLSLKVRLILIAVLVVLIVVSVVLEHRVPPALPEETEAAESFIDEDMTTEEAMELLTQSASDLGKGGSESFRDPKFVIVALGSMIIGGVMAHRIKNPKSKETKPALKGAKKKTESKYRGPHL